MKLKGIALAVMVLGSVGLMSNSSLSKENSSDVLVLSKDNVLVLDSEVNDESANKVMQDFKRINSGILSPLNKSPIYLYLRTPGGSIESGFQIIEALQASVRPVNTITSFAASMGFQIAQSLGERFILKTGTLMSHQAAGGMEGSFGGQEPSQLSNRYALWLEKTKEMDEQTVRRTNGKQTMESYTRDYNHELWLTGAQSVEKGYADKTVLVRCDSSLDGVTKHTMMIMNVIPVAYDSDNCPLNTAITNVRIDVPAVNKNDPTKTVKNIELNQFLQEGGNFGPLCKDAPSATLCAANPNLSLDKINAAVSEFKDSFTNKRALPFRW